MAYMFFNCNLFNQPLANWDVSNVKDMMYMFNNCKSFNQDISNWDVSNVKYSNGMFEKCIIKEKYQPEFN